MSGSTFIGKKGKIVIYDHLRVNGRSNYEYPGQRWVSNQVSIYIYFVRPSVCAQ